MKKQMCLHFRFSFLFLEIMFLAFLSSFPSFFLLCVDTTRGYPEGGVGACPHERPTAKAQFPVASTYASSPALPVLLLFLPMPIVGRVGWAKSSIDGCIAEPGRWLAPSARET